MHSLLEGKFHFRAGDVVFVAVDDRPERFFSERPTAGKYSKAKHGKKWFPIFAHQKRGNSSLNRRDSPRCFTVARRDSVPDAPDVFPALPADSVEERELQVIGLVAVPAIRDVHHVARLEPLVAIDARREREFVLAPR